MSKSSKGEGMSPPVELFIALAIMAPLLSIMYIGIYKPPLWTKLVAIVRTPRRTYSQRQHLSQEKKLLNDLIKDMRENPGHWVNNGYCPITFKGPSIVNDYSCIAIQYSLMGNGSPHRVMIHFNLNNLTQFEVQNDDSIATIIEGTHAQKFINTITDILDERGKELDYITTRIKERL